MDEVEAVFAILLKPGPADIMAAIAECGIRLTFTDMAGGQSSAIALHDSDFEITLSTSLSAERQRFAAAHELAHYLIHRDFLADHNGSQMHTDYLFMDDAPLAIRPLTSRHDAQASRMAVQMLLPKRKIEDLYERQGVRSAADLSRILGVAPDAVERRLQTLGLSAAA